MYHWVSSQRVHGRLDRIRQAIELDIERRGVYVIDASTNGTFLNGKPLPRKQSGKVLQPCAIAAEDVKLATVVPLSSLVRALAPFVVSRGNSPSDASAFLSARWN